MVKDHIPGLIVPNQPLPASPLLSGILSSVSTKITSIGHVDVECRESLFVSKTRIRLGVLRFDLEAERYRVLEINQTARFRRYVPDGHPSGQGSGWRTPEEDLVEMYFCRRALGLDDTP